MHPDTLDELWNIEGEDVDTDFPQNETRVPSTDLNASRLNENTRIIIHSTMHVVFLLCSMRQCTRHIAGIFESFI